MDSSSSLMVHPFNRQHADKRALHLLRVREDRHRPLRALHLLRVREDRHRPLRALHLLRVREDRHRPLRATHLLRAREDRHRPQTRRVADRVARPLPPAEDEAESMPTALP
jgi:hypothetical protein